MASYIGPAEPTNEELLKAIGIDPKVPISAVESAYSLFSRRASVNGVLNKCQQNGILFVSYTSVVRGLAATRLNQISDEEVTDLPLTNLKEKYLVF